MATKLKAAALADLPTPDEVQMCRQSLAVFLRLAWHVVEPGRPLVWNWHLDAICKHLEAVGRHEIRDMLVTIPPGTSKSRTAAVFWVAWEWLKNPGLRWLFVSNSDSNAKDTSLACRRLVESDWYRVGFGVLWELRDDQNAKDNYETTAGGHRQCFGIGSIITGRKGDIVVVDDANDAEKVESAAERKRVIRKYDDAIWDRVIDLKKGRHVVIGQCTHEEDLLNHLRRKGGYFDLCIPEEFVAAERYVSPIGWTDPRTEDGELLRPDQFGPEQAAGLRRNRLLSYLAKHQQRPRSREGYRFKRAWFKHRWVWDADREHMLLNGPRGSYRFHAMKDPLARFITADGAASAKTSADHTAIGSWILTPRYDLVWIGCRLVQAEIPEQPAILKEEYDRHKVWAAYIEAVFSNVALYQYAARSNMTVGAVNPHGKDKLTRATPALILAEAGQLWLPDDEEAETSGFPIDYVLEELCAFKGDPKLDLRDDVVDVLSYAVAVREDRGGDSGGSTAPGAVPQPKAGQWRQYGPKQGPQPKIMGGAR